MTHTPAIAAAPGWKIVSALLADLVLFALPLIFLVLAVRAGLADTAFLMGLVALAVLITSTIMLIRDGQSLGWKIAGVRLASQGGYPAIGARKPQGTTFMVADVRHGRDPLLPVSPRPVFSGVPPAPPTVSTQDTSSWVAPAEVSEGLGEIEHTIFAEAGGNRWQVIIDGNSNGFLQQPMVIGRNPSTQHHEQQVTVMDVSRQLSKNHVRLSLNDEGLPVVEDLGSTNGTSLSHEEGPPLTLPAGRRVIIDEQTRVLFCGHELSLARGG